MTQEQSPIDQETTDSDPLQEVWQNRLNSACHYGGCHKLDVHNWLKDLPEGINPSDWVEVRFKNTRKGVYRNVNNLPLSEGDVVAVEASPGHDIGTISLTGELVAKQLHKYKFDPRKDEFKKVYRKAKPVDIEKWKKATSREHHTMIRSRKIARSLGLQMKIGDVEYQGDGTKAIFYYIADERVDFRELIKVLADEFRIRVEMKQIGARQEAGLIGGIGSCGRELCCSTWITNFRSVTTNAARAQELSLNPQKLAGQCGKLKCCLNYELDVYLDAKRGFPRADIPLETKEGKAFHQKTDIFKRIMYYTAGDSQSNNIVALSVDTVKQIQAENRKGQKVEDLTKLKIGHEATPVDFEDIAGQQSLTRFDDKKKNERRRRPGKRRRPTKKRNRKK